MNKSHLGIRMLFISLNANQFKVTFSLEAQNVETGIIIITRALKNYS